MNAGEDKTKRMVGLGPTKKPNNFELNGRVGPSPTKKPDNFELNGRVGPSPTKSPTISS